MSEIPKLKIIKPLIESTTQFDGFLYESNLKEVNAFWDKYKDNIELFKLDFKGIIEREQVMQHEFNYWLHDLLYKPKEV
jgi:hypothetical protein